MKLDYCKEHNGSDRTDLICLAIRHDDGTLATDREIFSEIERLRSAISLMQHKADCFDELLDGADTLSPVAKVVLEDMGSPFRAISVRVHFFKEVPPPGTLLYKWPQPNAALTGAEGVRVEGTVMREIER